MRASSVAASIFATGLATAPALADPAYKAEAIVDFFAKAAREQFRPICIGTAAECPPPVSAFVFVLANFSVGSEKLTQGAKETLDGFAKALQDPRLTSRKFEIDGYADATGDERYNLELSEKRAASVVAYLASKGLDKPYSLIAKGFGASKPRVADPRSPENRRVEARMFGAVR